MSKHIAAATLTLLLASATAGAEPLHVDVEVDPTAYALSGNSIHVGLGTDRFRLDLGSFAMALPRWVHGGDGFDVSFHGYGAKLQLFVFGEARGLFTGVDAGLTRVLVRQQGTGLAELQHQVGIGAHVGYRIPVVGQLYVTPWLGVGYQFNADDVTLGGATYEAIPLSVFPAIHLGYRFR